MRPLHTVDTVVVGAGHAGLAVSLLLTASGRDHVVLERGRIADRWRSERWDSLHLLTPAWMTRLPGWYYAGPDPDEYLSAERLAQHLERYAESFQAPVVTGTTVEVVDVAPTGGYDVHTDGATWRTRHVVVATGPHGTPSVPAGLSETGIELVTSNRYRAPDQLAPGGVLVVGASSSGVQIADELSRAGRDVVLAVGRHTRMPRRYRGMDVFWWLEATGRLARTIDDVPDPAVARRETSFQLVGRNRQSPLPADLDLGILQARGVRLVGHYEGAEGASVRFSDDLAASVARADRTMHRFLDVVDDHVDRVGLAREVDPPLRPGPVPVPTAVTGLDLTREGISTVLVATGFRTDHSWLRVPAVGPDGALVHRRGVTEAPGVYVVGQRFQHRRDSGFIDGARHDACTVVHHLLTGRLPSSTAPATEPAA